jgi:hypothetical protein
VSVERAADLAYRGRLRAAERALGASARGDASATCVRAYVAAARGELARADRLARRVLASLDADPSLRARAAVTLGSALRQRGRHADARVVERAALRGARRAEDRSHLLIGLAADAVGVGDLAAVDDALRRVPETPRGWRVRVRMRWVRCERELLAGRPARAAGHARAALALSRRAGAARHEAKSNLFLGAALIESARRAGAPPRLEREAVDSLRRARAQAERIGARPITRVANGLLARERAARGR